MSFPVRLTREDVQALDTFDLLPLRQAVSLDCEGRIAMASQRLLDGLSRPERFRILRHGAGGQILARNGLALAEAQGVLQQVYGGLVSFGTPRVHTVTDDATGATLVPVMRLRIDAPRACRQAVVRTLDERAAAPREIAVVRDGIVVRTESPLAALIGLERQVLERTDGAAHVLCWLARYGPAHGSGARKVQA